MQSTSNTKQRSSGQKAIKNVKAPTRAAQLSGPKNGNRKAGRKQSSEDEYVKLDKVKDKKSVGKTQPQSLVSKVTQDDVSSIAISSSSIQPDNKDIADKLIDVLPAKEADPAVVVKPVAVVLTAVQQTSNIAAQEPQKTVARIIELTTLQTEIAENVSNDEDDSGDQEDDDEELQDEEVEPETEENAMIPLTVANLPDWIDCIDDYSAIEDLVKGIYQYDFKEDNKSYKQVEHKYSISCAQTPDYSTRLDSLTGVLTYRVIQLLALIQDRCVMCLHKCQKNDAYMTHTCIKLPIPSKKVATEYCREIYDRLIVMITQIEISHMKAIYLLSDPDTFYIKSSLACRKWKECDAKGTILPGRSAVFDHPFVWAKKVRDDILTNLHHVRSAELKIANDIVPRIEVSLTDRAKMASEGRMIIDKRMADQSAYIKSKQDKFDKDNDHYHIIRHNIVPNFGLINSRSENEVMNKALVRRYKRLKTLCLGKEQNGWSIPPEGSDLRQLLIHKSNYMLLKSANPKILKLKTLTAIHVGLLGVVTSTRLIKLTDNSFVFSEDVGRTKVEKLREPTTSKNKKKSKTDKSELQMEQAPLKTALVKGINWIFNIKNLTIELALQAVHGVVDYTYTSTAFVKKFLMHDVSALVGHDCIAYIRERIGLVSLDKPPLANQILLLTAFGYNNVVCAMIKEEKLLKDEDFDRYSLYSSSNSFSMPDLDIDADSEEPDVQAEEVPPPLNMGIYDRDQETAPPLGDLIELVENGGYRATQFRNIELADSDNGRVIYYHWGQKCRPKNPILAGEAHTVNLLTKHAIELYKQQRSIAYGYNGALVRDSPRFPHVFSNWLVVDAPHQADNQILRNATYMRTCVSNRSITVMYEKIQGYLAADPSAQRGQYLRSSEYLYNFKDSIAASYKNVNDIGITLDVYKAVQYEWFVDLLTRIRIDRPFGIRQFNQIVIANMLNADNARPNRPIVIIIPILLAVIGYATQTLFIRNAGTLGYTADEALVMWRVLNRQANSGIGGSPLEVVVSVGFAEPETWPVAVTASNVLFISREEDDWVVDLNMPLPAILSTGEKIIDTETYGRYQVLLVPHLTKADILERAILIGWNNNGIGPMLGGWSSPDDMVTERWLRNKANFKSVWGCVSSLQQLAAREYFENFSFRYCALLALTRDDRYQPMVMNVYSAGLPWNDEYALCASISAIDTAVSYCPAFYPQLFEVGGYKIEDLLAFSADTPNSATRLHCRTLDLACEFHGNVWDTHLNDRGGVAPNERVYTSSTLYKEVISKLLFVTPSLRLSNGEAVIIPTQMIYNLVIPCSFEALLFRLIKTNTYYTPDVSLLYDLYKSVTEGVTLSPMELLKGMLHMYILNNPTGIALMNPQLQIDTQDYEDGFRFTLTPQLQKLLSYYVGTLLTMTSVGVANSYRLVIQTPYQRFGDSLFMTVSMDLNVLDIANLRTEAQVYQLSYANLEAMRPAAIPIFTKTHILGLDPSRYTDYNYNKKLFLGIKSNYETDIAIARRVLTYTDTDPAGLSGQDKIAIEFVEQSRENDDATDV